MSVGELRAVDPELLKFAWEGVTCDGPDAGSVLDIEWHTARQLCEQCGGEKRGEMLGWLSLCPDCGCPLKVEGGMELDVLQVSFLTADEVKE